MKNNRWLVLLGALAALAAGPGFAQERGLYLGGSVGEAIYSDTCSDYTVLTGCNDGDTAFRVFLGYQFNRNFAIEGGWANLGEVDSQGLFAGVPTTFRSEANGYDVAAVVSWPVLEHLSLYGKLGVSYVRTRIERNSGGVVSQGSHYSGGFTYGLGVEFGLWRLGLRAEWQHYDNAASTLVDEDNVDYYSIGLVLRF